MPALIAAALVRWEREELSPEVAADAATLCVDCGACERWCHLDQPLPRVLREARAQLLPEPLIEPLRPIQGEGSLVAVEADGRPLAGALSTHLGEPVRRWFTADQLGVATLEHPVWGARAQALRDRLRDEKVVVCDGGVALALSSAGVAFTWLHELVPDLAAGYGSCRSGGPHRPLECCGAADPLHTHHPDDARRVGKAWLARADTQQVVDGRCRNHLLACGGLEVSDALDRLLERVE